MGQESGNLVTLKMLGFSDVDKARFSSILTLAERLLKKNWLITNDLSADFFFIKEALIPLMDQHELLKNLPRRQCIYVKYNPAPLDADARQFYWGNSEVPSLRLLVEFLNQLTDDQPARPAPAAAPTTVVEADVFDPEQSFVRYLLEPIKYPRAFKLANQDAGLTLYVDVDQQTYYSSVPLAELTAFFFAADQLRIDNLSAQTLQAALASAGQSLKPQPLSHLLWFAAFSCSQGKPIKGYNSGDIVHLTRWPDINLPGCRPLIKLAAFMHSNAVDLATAQAKTALPLTQIYNFYNACKLTGLIGQSQQTDVHEKTLDDEQKKLFARIGKRLDQAGGNASGVP